MVFRGALKFKVDAVANVRTYNNRVIGNEKNNQIRGNEKKSPPFQENSFFENEKEISTEQELKNGLSENWIDETCIRNDYDKETFSTHVEGWISRKIATKDFKFKICKLQSFCIEDFIKRPARKQKSESWEDTEKEFAAIIKAQKKQKKEALSWEEAAKEAAKVLEEEEEEEEKRRKKEEEKEFAAEVEAQKNKDHAAPPQKVLETEKVSEWDIWANDTVSRHNFDQNEFQDHVMLWIRSRNIAGETIEITPELKRTCINEYMSTIKAPERTSWPPTIETEHVAVIDEPEPPEPPPAMNTGSLEEVLKMSKRQTTH